MSDRIRLKDGLHHAPRYGLVMISEGQKVYGFKVKPKGISKEQREAEIKKILVATDEFCKLQAYYKNPKKY